MFYEISKFICWLPLSILHPTKIIGRENLPKKRVILTLNHRSNWDIVLFLLHTKGRFKVLAKKELFKNKLFGAVLHNFGGIEIEREANDITAMKQCLRVLKDEQRLVIFPEGTRLKDDSKILGEIKSGLAMIAIKTKTPIVPVWADRRPKLFRLSKIRIGKPFELSEFYDKKLDEQTLAEATEIVREKMLELFEQSQNEKKKKQKNKKN